MKETKKLEELDPIKKEAEKWQKIVTILLFALGFILVLSSFLEIMAENEICRQLLAIVNEYTLYLFFTLITTGCFFCYFAGIASNQETNRVKREAGIKKDY